MSLHESGENYLETILLLGKRLGKVRSVDIANELDYSKPSISRAMSILKKSGFIEMDKSGLISLTQTGLDKANEIYERHRLITKYLVLTLGVEDSVAETDACRIEHVISSETFYKIKDFVLNIEKK
ncbi:MAG: metal-dependent transcriptional regulator [Clostridia bacterium]|nr:metal-dependent transcriptional regulator [Clostridia bacterium]